MKCPKCSYVSHDYLDACRKCGVDLVDFKQAMNLRVVQPGNLDLSEMLNSGRKASGAPGDLGLQDEFFRQQVVVEPEDDLPDGDEDFDISLDDDSVVAQKETFLDDTAAAGEREELAEQEALAADAEAEYAAVSGPAPAPETTLAPTMPADFFDLDEFDEEEIPATVTPHTESTLDASAAPPLDMIDMSDLMELGDETLDTPLDETVLDFEETVIAPELPSEVASSSAPEIERSSTGGTEDDTTGSPDESTAEETIIDLDTIPSDHGETVVFDETPAPMVPEPADGLSDLDVPETVLDLVPDEIEIIETELALEEAEEAASVESPAASLPEAVPEPAADDTLEEAELTLELETDEPLGSMVLQRPEPVLDEDLTAAELTLELEEEGEIPAAEVNATPSPPAGSVEDVATEAVIELEDLDLSDDEKL